MTPYWWTAASTSSAAPDAAARNATPPIRRCASPTCQPAYPLPATRRGRRFKTNAMHCANCGVNSRCSGANRRRHAGRDCASQAPATASIRSGWQPLWMHCMPRTTASAMRPRHWDRPPDRSSRNCRVTHNSGSILTGNARNTAAARCVRQPRRLSDSGADKLMMSCVTAQNGDSCRRRPNRKGSCFFRRPSALVELLHKTLGCRSLEP